MVRNTLFRALWLALVGSLVVVGGGDRRSVRADDPPGLQLPGQLGISGFGDIGGSEAKAEYSARIEAQNGGPAGRLVVTAKIAKDWHIYSVTQKKGGPQPTKFELIADPAIKVDGAYRPDKAAKVHRSEVYDGLEVEEHFDTVTWRVNVELPKGVDPASFVVKMKVRGQVCNEASSCIPLSLTIPVKLSGFAPGATRTGAPGKKSEVPPATPASNSTTSATAAAEKPFAPGPYQGQPSHVRWSGKVRWDFVARPDSYELVLDADVDEKWHVYAFSAKPMSKTSEGIPTLIAITDRARWSLETPQPSANPIHKVVAGIEQTFHEHHVSWTMPVKLNAGAGGGDLRGLVGFQTCSNTNCDPPSAAEFSVALPDPKSSPSGELAIGFRRASYSAAVAAVEGKVVPSVSPAEVPAAAAVSVRNWEVRRLTGDNNLTLWSALGLAFVGGFLLNFMPCVLPVIGLKLVAFVQQSQGSRKQTLLLNVYYSLGLISVFMVLAVLAAAPQWVGSSEKLRWAEQFQSSTFNTIMASAIFVFALSNLGIWEIPMPGMVGTGKAADLARREGFWGAFAKGAFTTVMATPCTGPFMGSALTWSVGQSTSIAFATFFTLGLGMALPYLLIGAFPQLLRFVPKPGAWMDTFKQAMGFVLLATVVYFFSFIPKDVTVPTIGLLVGLGMACWWIGRTPVYAELKDKLRAWSIGTVMAAAVGWLSFFVFGPANSLLDWQEFSRAEFEELLNGGQTVMVDFTADWCPNCKVNERFSYNIPRTQAVVKANGVVVIKADKTHLDERSDPINQLLNELGNPLASIPYLAIFPGNGAPPIVLDGPVTPGLVEQALREAGPSRSTGDKVARAP